MEVFTSCLFSFKNVFNLADPFNFQNKQYESKTPSRAQIRLFS